MNSIVIVIVRDVEVVEQETVQWHASGCGVFSRLLDGAWAAHKGFVSATSCGFGTTWGGCSGVTPPTLYETSQETQQETKGTYRGTATEQLTLRCLSTHLLGGPQLNNPGNTETTTVRRQRGLRCGRRLHVGPAYLGRQFGRYVSPGIILARCRAVRPTFGAAITGSREQY